MVKEEEVLLVLDVEVAAEVADVDVEVIQTQQQMWSVTIAGKRDTTKGIAVVLPMQMQMAEDVVLDGVISRSAAMVMGEAVAMDVDDQTHRKSRVLIAEKSVITAMTANSRRKAMVKPIGITRTPRCLSRKTAL